MAKYYEYIATGRWRFQVIKRWKDKKGMHMTEHFVSRNKGRWLCDCKGFNYSKPPNKICSHIKFIKEQLALFDFGIIKTESNFSCDKINELERRYG